MMIPLQPHLVAIVVVQHVAHPGCYCFALVEQLQLSLCLGKACKRDDHVGVIIGPDLSPRLNRFLVHLTGLLKIA